MAQSVKCLTLDLSSGLDLGVVSSNPALGSMLLKSLLKILSLSLCPSPPLSKQNKTFAPHKYRKHFIHIFKREEKYREKLNIQEPITLI